MVDKGNGTGPLNIFGQVTLDGSGYGYIRFAPVGTSWEITSASVACSSAAKEAVCRVYRGLIGPVYMIDQSVSGSTGDVTNTVYKLNDGEALLVEWTGGDPGATATCRLSGTQDI